MNRSINLDLSVYTLLFYFLYLCDFIKYIYCKFHIDYLVMLMTYQAHKWRKKHSSKYENELKKIFEDNGFVGIRASGSLGDVDLVIYDPNRPMTLFFEVKDTTKDVFKPYQREREQYYNLKKLYEKGCNVYYAIRFVDNSRERKENKWFIYPLKNIPYPFRLIRSPLDVKRFDENKDIPGIKLTDFLEHIDLYYDKVSSDNIGEKSTESIDTRVGEYFYRVVGNTAKITVLLSLVNSDYDDSLSRKLDDLTHKVSYQFVNLDKEGFRDTIKELYGIFYTMNTRFYNKSIHDLVVVNMEYIEYIYSVMYDSNIKEDIFKG